MSIVMVQSINMKVVFDPLAADMVILCFVCRYQLPIVFIVMNNNGIYQGVNSEAWKDITESPDLPLRLLIYWAW